MGIVLLILGLLSIPLGICWGFLVRGVGLPMCFYHTVFATRLLIDFILEELLVAMYFLSAEELHLSHFLKSLFIIL